MGQSLNEAVVATVGSYSSGVSEASPSHLTSCYILRVYTGPALLSDSPIG